MAYGKQNLVICYSNPVSCDCLRQVLRYQNRKPEITVGRMVCKCYSGGHRLLDSELCRWFCVLDKQSDWWLPATLENAQSRKALCNKSPSDQCYTQWAGWVVVCGHSNASFCSHSVCLSSPDPSAPFLKHFPCHSPPPLAPINCPSSVSPTHLILCFSPSHSPLPSNPLSAGEHTLSLHW